MSKEIAGVDFSKCIGFKYNPVPVLPLRALPYNADF
jgi:hypothetical protein